MPNTGHKGIDVRQSTTCLLFRVLLQDSAGAIVTTGTTSLRLYELQSDGTLLSYDFNDNTFKAGALTTNTLAMTHRQGNNNTYDTGIWTTALATLTGFTTNAIYLAHVSNTGASPAVQVREFQFGGAQGDDIVQTGDSFARLGAPAGASVSADTLEIQSRLPAALVGGRIDASAGAVAANAITAAAIATGAIDADAIADNAIDAGAIATGAIDADSIAADAVTKIQSGLSAASAAAVWNALTASYTATGSFGAWVSSLISGIWNWTGTGGRSVTQSGASLATATTEGAIVQTRGDVWSITRTDMAANTGYTAIIFSIKASADDGDDAALVRIRLDATPTDPVSDGLQRLNAHDPGDLTAGSITVNSATSITIHLDADKTAQLPAETEPTPVYDVQYIFSTGPTTPESGTFTITADVTRTTT